jgi:EmrB/QacA subfamily drug resistance transporter
MAGLVLFGAASFVGGFSQTEGMLIIARAVQGLGAALLSPAALSILTTVFREGAERNRALGVWGAVAGAGGAAGVLLGGILTQYLSWRWVLYVNVPIAVGAVLLAPRLVPESRDERERNGFDVAGAFTVTAGLAVLIYALVDANSAGWGSAQTVGLLALAVVLLVSFVVIESRSAAPLVPFDVFSSRTRTGAYATGLLVGASLFSMFFFISLYMQQVLGWDALKSGLAYLPLAITIILSAGAASVLVTKIGFKPVVIAGLFFIAAGLILFSRISAGGSFLGDVLFPSLLAAMGLGFSFVPVTIGGTTGISQDEAGLASGLINAGQQVGGALGLAILAALATARTDAVATGPGKPSATALTEGFSAAFLGGAGFALIGAVLAIFLIRSEDSRALIGQGQAPEPAA